MKRYLLLRDNQEKGPFTIEEMKVQQLKTQDLVWVEGESASWKYPSEIEGLKELVRADVKETNKLNSGLKNKDKSVFILLPFGHRKPDISQSERIGKIDYLGGNDDVGLETKYSVSLDELKTKYAEQLERRRFQFPISIARPKAALIPALFIGLLFTAFFLKKWMTNSNDGPKEEMISVAQPLTEGGMFNEASHSARQYQNAIVNEVLAVDTLQNKSAKKMKPMNLEKMVSVKNSDYKVGLFGGINNLKLTILNNSPHPLDKVAVTVDYLKPSGYVIKSENFYFLNVAPKSSKTLSIPPSNRGVKVRTRIQKIQSKQYQISMLQL